MSARRKNTEANFHVLDFTLSSIDIMMSTSYWLKSPVEAPRHCSGTRHRRAKMPGGGVPARAVAGMIKRAWAPFGEGLGL